MEIKRQTIEEQLKVLKLRKAYEETLKNKNMETDRLLNLIAFCVLMQNKDGILGKSPDYVLEKYDRFLDKGFTDLENYWGLDAENIAKVEVWYKKWLT